MKEKYLSWLSCCKDKGSHIKGSLFHNTEISGLWNIATLTLSFILPSGPYQKGFRNCCISVIVNKILFYASGETKMVDFKNTGAGHESLSLWLVVYSLGARCPSNALQQSGVSLLGFGLHLLQGPCTQGCRSHGCGPCWAPQQWRKSFKREVSALPGHSPWHRSLPPGQGQLTGSPTKAPLPGRVIGGPKRRTAVGRCAGRHQRKQRPAFLYTLFLHLTACRHAGFGGQWRDVESSGQIRIKAVIEGLTEGLSSPGFAYHWAEQGCYRISRCCMRLENSKRGKCCKTLT